MEAREIDCPGCGEKMRWKGLEKDICPKCNPELIPQVRETDCFVSRELYREVSEERDHLRDLLETNRADLDYQIRYGQKLEAKLNQLISSLDECSGIINDFKLQKSIGVKPV